MGNIREFWIHKVLDDAIIYIFSIKCYKYIQKTTIKKKNYEIRPLIIYFFLHITFFNGRIFILLTIF